MAENPEGSDSDSDEVIDLGPLDLFSDRLPFHLARAERLDNTRARIAYVLIGILAGVLLSLVVLLANHTLAPDEVERLSAALVSPMIGLVGAVTGYYYGRSDRS